MSAAYRVQVRWPDIDALGHVNHSATLAYLEVGRDALLSELGIRPDSYVIRRCEVDYLGELRPEGGYAEYRLDALEAGRTSIRTTERLVHGDETAVSATFVLVMWDGAARRARELTDEERRGLSIPHLHQTMTNTGRTI